MPRSAAIALVTVWAFLTLGVAAARTAPAPMPPLRTAGAFMLDDIRFKVDGKWDLVWQSLYPAHQAEAPRRIFDRCEAGTPFAAPLQGATLAGVRRTAVRVPGQAGTVPGVAVTVRVALEWYGPRDPIQFEHTFHLVPVNGRWTWLLSKQRYALYAHEGCRNLPAA